MDDEKRHAELQRLQPLVGTWDATVTFPAGGLQPLRGRTVFSWTLGGAYLQERSDVPAPVPDSLSIIGPAAGGTGITQHYFDERGVVRLYAMTIIDGVWTLLRETADFSPLPFHQRFVGTFSADADRIDGRWERRPDDASEWELDFHLAYTRVATGGEA